MGVAMELRSSLSCLILLSLLVGSCVHASIVVSKLDRKVDLISHNVRSITSMKVDNEGPDSVSQVYFVLPTSQSNNLAFIGASASEGKGKSKTAALNLPVKLAESNDVPEDMVLFAVILNKDLKPGESILLEMYAVFSEVLKPFPSEISQAEAQYVLYQDSAYAPSVYPVKMQSTVYRLPSPRVESYTKVESVKLTKNELKYGPYENTAPFSTLPIEIHYENNRPFAVVESLEREIEISNWGNIYVTEKYHLVHGGAHHKGSFSRLDYQTKPGMSGVAALRQLLARLPPRAHSVYYRDEIGNISTSHLRSDKDKTELEFEPRYPLLGGWHVTFTIGYGVPLQDYVFKAADGRRYLKFPFGCPLHDVFVKNLVVKVVLPEGSKDPSVSVPFGVHQSEEVKHSYLDTVGRTVIVLSKKNIVQEHNVFFEVHFKFSTISMLVEPLMLITGFFLFFVACIAYNRMDFSLSKSSPAYQARIQREELIDAVQKLQNIIHFRQVNISDKLDSSLKDLARTGDIQSCKATRKAADAALKDTSKDLKTVLENFQSSSRNTNVVNKVDKLVTKEKEKQEKLLQKHAVVVESYERKVPNKEIDSRIEQFEKKITALKQEISDLLESLDDF